MRYVIVIIATTIFVLWDVATNDGHTIAAVAREVARMTGYFGLG